MSKDKTFIFIAGVEGSGTTLLLRVLAKLQGSVALGGAFHSKYYALPRWLMNRITDRLWAFPERPRKKAKYVALLQAIVSAVPGRYVVYKRSYPFNDLSYFPDVLDFEGFPVPTKVIVLKRALESNAKSILRRGFVKTIEEARIRTDQALSMLDEQTEKLDASKLLRLRYEDMIDPAKKHMVLDQIAAFIGCESGELQALAGMIDKPTGG
ncbi:MAG: hypothetical protein Q8Q73_11175 [Stagnimonas sp.]|nr:hypothetical protein [Stagnimonas sp.]